MIRFVDVGDQITCDDRKQFAWYDTVTDRFLILSGGSTWEAWEDFEKDLLDEYPESKNPDDVWSVTRFWHLLQWRK